MTADKIKSDLRAYYDQEAEFRNLHEKQEWKIAQRKVFSNLAVHENKKTLLEIGAGTGQDSNEKNNLIIKNGPIVRAGRTAKFPCAAVRIKIKTAA